MCSIRIIVAIWFANYAISPNRSRGSHYSRAAIRESSTTHSPNMKKLLSLAILLCAVRTFGSLVAYEPFNYPVGVDAGTNLVGHTTSDGFTWSQAGPTTGGTNVPAIAAGNLSYPGLAPSIGNSTHFGGIDSGGMAARFSLKSPVTSGTLYFSFLLEILETNNLSTGGVFYVGFNNTAGAQGSLPTTVDTRFVTRLSGTGFQLGLDKSSGVTTNFQWDPTIYTTGQVFLVVGSYTFNTGTSTDDESDMWINPDSTTFGAASPPTLNMLSSTKTNDISAINSFCIFNRNAAEPHSMIIDEITIGTTWADVTPTANSLAFISQPSNQRVIVGGQSSFSVSAYRALTYQWQHNGVNISGATNGTYTITNAQLSDAGSYNVIIGNGVISSNSATATLTVIPDTFPRLVPVWSIAPFSRPYMTIDSSTSPNQRYIAYNALSNQVLVVSRTNTLFNYPTNAAIYVLNADSGADLYQMNTDATVITGGFDINGGGTNLITLNGLDVAADGAVYGCNVGNAAVPPNWLNVYRWDNSGPTAGPANIWQSDPTGLNNVRWGDSIAVRGSGDNTQILLDSSTGVWGALITNNAGTWQAGYFTNLSGGSTGGRTLLFYGSDNTFWEKHGGNGLTLLSYDLGAHTSAIVTNFNNLAGSPNLVAFNSTSNLLCAIGNDSTTSPDTVQLYDISNPTQPLLISSYNFPTNHQANANGCGRVIFAGERVFALDSNNGLMALVLVPRLTLTAALPNVVLSWPSSFSGYMLQATPSLTSPVNWTNVSSGVLNGSQYSVTNNAASGRLFYRLHK
jgi:hypothetical protein